MTVLSDQEIRLAIAQGGLVPGGDPGRATECSYFFLPGRAFLAGSNELPIDFPGPTNEARVIVEPGRMIWIRTLDQVAIPDSIVGFWWQTNTLSKKGLMLVNMSMVEPGYHGDLACLFMNFGKAKVLIERDTPIAKMVFVDIRGTVSRPFTTTIPRRQYDTRLNELALAQPASFLQVGELAGDLQRERDEAVASVRSTSIDAKALAAADLKAARDEAVSQFKKDIPGAVKSAFWLALGLFAILTIVSAGTSWLKGEFVPDIKKTARSEAEEVFRERVMITATPNQAETAALLRRIDELNRRIDAVERKD